MSYDQKRPEHKSTKRTVDPNFCVAFDHGFVSSRNLFPIKYFKTFIRNKRKKT